MLVGGSVVESALSRVSRQMESGGRADGMSEMQGVDTRGLVVGCLRRGRGAASGTEAGKRINAQGVELFANTGFFRLAT